MIKVEVIKKVGSIQFIFESRSQDEKSLDELDLVYSALMGSEAKRGGYLGSNRFEIEVRDEDQDWNIPA